MKIVSCLLIAALMSGCAVENATDESNDAEGELAASVSLPNVDVVRLTSDSRTRTAGSSSRVKKILQALKTPTSAQPRCASREKATLELFDEAGNDVGKGEIACGRGTLHMKDGEEIEIAAKLDDLEDHFEGTPYVGDAVWGITSVTISDVRAGKKKTIRDKASVARAVEMLKRDQRVTLGSNFAVARCRPDAIVEFTRGGTRVATAVDNCGGPSTISMVDPSGRDETIKGRIQFAGKAYFEFLR